MPVNDKKEDVNMRDVRRSVRQENDDKMEIDVINGRPQISGKPSIPKVKLTDLEPNKQQVIQGIPL